MLISRNIETLEYQGKPVFIILEPAAKLIRIIAVSSSA